MISLSVFYLTVATFVFYEWFTFKDDDDTVRKTNLQISTGIMALPIFVVSLLLIITYLP